MSSILNVRFGALSPEKVEEYFTRALAIRRLPSREWNGKQDAGIMVMVRKLCRESLPHFVRWIMPDYEFAPHHVAICKSIEELESGSRLRQVVSSPPRTGKSLLVSIMGPAWILGRGPKREVVEATYGQDLSNTFGRQFRNILRSADFTEIFPECILDEAAQSVDTLRTKAGGGMLYTSKGSALTGRGFDFGIADDLIRDAAEAGSMIVKTALMEWWRAVFLTRQAPNAAIMVCATRWALDDVTGTIIEEGKRGGEVWPHLHFKAIDDDGKALWPEWFPLDIMERRRIEVGPKVWRCLYQNDPVAEDGNFFKSDWLDHYFLPMDVPPHIRKVAASDFALSGGSGDYTVHLIVGIIRNAMGSDEYYVLDMWRKQAPIEESVAALCALLQKHRDCDVYVAEHDNIILASGAYIRERMHASGVHPYFVKVSRLGNKEAKAGSLQGSMEAGRVRWPQHATWLKDVQDEFLSFPDGLHDDIVDTLANILRGVVGGRVRPKAEGNVIHADFDPKQPFGGHVALGKPGDRAMMVNRPDRERI